MTPHSEDRETWYEAEVRRNAYRLRVEVLVEGGAAYLVSGSDRELLCRPLVTKRFWYETWLALKGKHGDLSQFIRQPDGRTK
jgi:hypothetical protein